MHSLEEITDSLKNDRDTIVDNLTTMGIEDLEGNETFTELAPRILEIASGGQTIQYDVMPTASSENLGSIVQYTGATDANYTNGYFYQVVSDGQEPATYSWENINVQDVGGSVDATITYLPPDVGTQQNPFVFADHETGIYITDIKSLNSNFYIKAKSTDASAHSYMLKKGMILIDYKSDINNYTSGTLWFADIYTGIPSYSERVLYQPKYTSSGLDTSSSSTQTFMLANEVASISKKHTYYVLPESSVAPTTNNQLVNKAYVDANAGGNNFTAKSLSEIRNTSVTNSPIDFTTAEVGMYINDIADYDSFYYKNMIDPEQGGTSSCPYHPYLLVIEKETGTTAPSSGFFFGWMYAFDTSGNLYVLHFFVNRLGQVNKDDVAIKDKMVINKSSQTFTGTKTFSSVPECSTTPTTNNQLTNKAYVDSAIASAITTTLGGSY